VAIVPLALGFALAALALTRKRRRNNRPRGIR
jgi:hypothetical protein